MFFKRHNFVFGEFAHIRTIGITARKRKQAFDFLKIETQGLSILDESNAFSYLRRKLSISYICPVS